MKPAICYVLRGKCEYIFGSQIVVFSAGTWAELPGGDYTFRVLGDDEMETVLAWRLPFAVPPLKGKAT